MHRTIKAMPAARNRTEMKYPCDGVAGPMLPRYATAKVVWAKSAERAPKNILALIRKKRSPMAPAPHDLFRVDCFKA